MPNDGRMRIYTSGCPKIQKRCCQSNGSAPIATLKKLASNVRSKLRSTRATVMTGKAKSSKNWTTRIIQVKTGIRSMVIPGALILTIVTMRLIEPTREAMPTIWSPSA